ncbi:MAG: hypothetical protein K2X91_00090 [Thermoleophilia bacterium]|nr:hypothetical protein [Thermoleophilia bacterium]
MPVTAVRVSVPAVVRPSSDDLAPAANPGAQFEAGLRICPRCGMPVHLSAENCRQCGATVPRR